VGWDEEEHGFLREREREREREMIWWHTAGVGLKLE
jgi:hypothetical protein